VADELVGAVRAFVAKEVVPAASALEHADTYPKGWVDQLAGMGLFGATIPAEHGGLALDVATYARVVEELAYGWMSLTGVLNTHMIAATLIASHGTPAQKGRWLPPWPPGS
jgi:alkylation response protein AidB-like acyl-CoA dehydrogenase